MNQKKILFFNDMNLGGIDLNRNKLDNNRIGNKRELEFDGLKDKKGDNKFGINNSGDLGLNRNKNNNFGRYDKFDLYERNNPIMNQFNKEMNMGFRRKKNYYRSPNSLGWNI